MTARAKLVRIGALALGLTALLPSGSAAAPVVPSCEKLAYLQDPYDYRLCRAQALRAQARAKGEPELYAKAANELFQLWQTHSDVCRQGDPRCARLADVLLLVAHTYELAGDYAKGIAARKLLIDERYPLRHTPAAEQASFEVGESYERLGILERAAHFYERHGRDRPAGSRAGEALWRALRLQLLLGQIAQAEALHQLLAGRPDGLLPGLTALLAIAEHRAQRGEWRAVKQQLSPALKALDSLGEEEGLGLQARALLGRAHAAEGDGAAAGRLFAEIRRRWRKLTQAEPRPALGQRAADAMAEALIFAARQRLPTQTGPPPALAPATQAPLPAPKLVRWAAARERELSEVAVILQQVPSLEPRPHPRWIIRAHAEEGDLWHALTEQLRAPAQPLSPSLREHYLAAVAAVIAPPAQKARTAYRACRHAARSARFFDARAYGCDRWLGRHYPAELPPVFELWAAPQPIPLRDAPPLIDLRGEIIR